jgi:transposase
MHATIKAVRIESSAAATRVVELIKDMFELACVDAAGRIVEPKRLKRGAFAE